MLSHVSTNAKKPLYEAVAERISYLIEQGTLRPGDRVPSIRNLSKQMQVSINTVKEAYASLKTARSGGSASIGLLCPGAPARPAAEPVSTHRS